METKKGPQTVEDFEKAAQAFPDQIKEVMNILGQYPELLKQLEGGLTKNMTPVQIKEIILNGIKGRATIMSGGAVMVEFYELGQGKKYYDTLC